MASSSSARKIARLAAKGKGRKVRMQGGTLFPTVIFVVCVLGVALIAYARQSQDRVSALDTAKQNYYTAFGIYRCNEFIDGLPGSTNFADGAAELKPGAYIDAPGIVRWEPQVLSGERRAKLQTIFDLFELKVGNDSIEFPTTLNNGEAITEGDTECDGKGASVQVVVWDDATVVSSSKVSIADLGNVRLTGDGMAITLAFVAKGVDVPQPPSTADLELLLATAQG